MPTPFANVKDFVAAYLVADRFHELRRTREGERALGLGLAEVVGEDGLVLAGVVSGYLFGVDIN